VYLYDDSIVIQLISSTENKLLLAANPVVLNSVPQSNKLVTSPSQPSTKTSTSSTPVVITISTTTQPSSQVSNLFMMTITDY